MNEAWVEARRRVPGNEVLAEFVETTDRRLDALRAMPPERFDVVGWSPVGEVPYREFMGPGSSTPGPTSRTSAARWVGPAAATGSARRSSSTGASGPCPTWWASGSRHPTAPRCSSW